MAHPILMPRFGQMTETSVLTTWHKQEGDAVHKGDVLFEIETDKSAMEVEAFVEGTLLRQLVAEGEEVAVNTVCGYVGDPGEAIPDRPPATDTAAAPPDRVEPEPTSPAGKAASGVPDASSRATAAAPAEGRLRISPRATRLAAEAGVDPRTIAGTGPDGRIVERDVRAAIEARGAAVAPAAPEAATPAPAPQPAPAGPAAHMAPGGDEEPPRPLSRMRRVIAERLTLSATTIPTFTVTTAVDVTSLLTVRRELKAEGRDFTVTDFVLSATAQGLAEFPDVNARTDGVSVWPRRRIHLGLAVSLPTGLVVPVIRDADRLSVDGIHEAAARLATAARDGRLAPDELSGSTFTVSNLGMFGVDEFTAIINPGESGILAVGSAVEMPVAIGGGIGIRSIMRLTLTADHRLVDGELGARFLNAIRRRLEDYRAFRRDAIHG